MNLIFIVTSVIAFLIITIFGILISHRICGPIFKLCRHMNNIADGENPTEIKFRKNDYFKEIESSFNRIVNNIFNKK
jgi:nitrogen fixation/metabolism regulation signal transduction histidine kinase